MAKVKEHSFDISAKLDMQEMKNALVQAKKRLTIVMILKVSQKSLI